MTREWMAAPHSPLSDEQVKALAQAVVYADHEPNEVYMTDKDSLALWGEVSVVWADRWANHRAPGGSA